MKMKASYHDLQGKMDSLFPWAKYMFGKGAVVSSAVSILLSLMESCFLLLICELGLIPALHNTCRILGR